MPKKVLLFICLLLIVTYSLQGIKMTVKSKAWPPSTQ